MVIEFYFWNSVLLTPMPLKNSQWQLVTLATLCVDFLVTRHGLAPVQAKHISFSLSYLPYIRFKLEARRSTICHCAESTFSPFRRWGKQIVGQQTLEFTGLSSSKHNFFIAEGKSSTSVWKYCGQIICGIEPIKGPGFFWILTNSFVDGSDR
jgi:hypothetical protein